MWAWDGREIFYRTATQMMSVPIAQGPTLDAGNPSPLFDDQYRGDHANHLPNYDVAPDGRFLMVRSDQRAASIHVVLNWGEELKRLVPPE